MPKATKTTRKSKDTPEDMLEDTEQNIGEDTDENLFEEIANDTIIYVHRLDERSKKWVRQFRLAKHEATEDTIQELRGGGTYKARERVMQPNGQSVWGRQRTFTIDGPVKPLSRLPDSMTAQVSGAESKEPEKESKGGGIEDTEMSAALRAQVISMLKDHNELVATQMASLRASMDDRKSAQPDSTMQLTLQMMMKSMEQNTQLLSAMIANRPQPPDVFDQLPKLAELMRVNSSPTTTVKDTLEMMQGFIGVRQEIDDYQRGPQEPPKDMAELAMEQFGKLVDAIGNAKSLEQLRSDVAKLPPPQQLQPTGEQPTMKQYAGMLKPHIPRFVSLAQREKNPVLIADADFETMTDMAHGVLKQLLSGENPLNEVIQTFPELSPYVNWVNMYLGRLHQHYFPEAYQQQEGDSTYQGPGVQSSEEEESGIGPPAKPDASRSGAMVIDETPEEN